MPFFSFPFFTLLPPIWSDTGRHHFWHPSLILLTLFTPCWHFPEDLPWLVSLQSGSCPATWVAGGWQVGGLSHHWYPYKVALDLPQLVGSLSQHQCTAMCLQQLRLDLAASHTGGPSCTPAYHQQLQSNPPAASGVGVLPCTPAYLQQL